MVLLKNQKTNSLLICGSSLGVICLPKGWRGPFVGLFLGFVFPFTLAELSVGSLEESVTCIVISLSWLLSDLGTTLSWNSFHHV